MQGTAAPRAMLTGKPGWHLPCTSAEGGPMDLLFVVATIAFFAVSLAYVRGCDRL